MRIIGYAYQASHCCPNCTREAAARGALTRKPPLRLDTDEHGIAFDLVDFEGNPVTPIFSTDEHPPEGIDCEECGDVIADEGDTPRRWLKEADSEGERDHSMCLALYVYLSNNPRGQRSPEYECLCRILTMYRPSPLQSLNEDEAFEEDMEAQEAHDKFKSAEWCVRDATDALGV